MPQMRGALDQLRLSGWDFVASGVNGHRWGMPLLGRAAREAVAWALERVQATELAGVRSRKPRAASVSACCWPRRCWGDRVCCCLMNR